MRNEVIVKVVNGMSDEELETLIRMKLNLGFVIQNSQVEWSDGKINGVYVFIRAIR